jgi:hypothetical protein
MNKIIKAIIVLLLFSAPGYCGYSGGGGTSVNLADPLNVYYGDGSNLTGVVDSDCRASTGTLQTQITAIGVSTGTIQAQLDLVQASTGTFDGGTVTNGITSPYVKVSSVNSTNGVDFNTDTHYGSFSFKDQGTEFMGCNANAGINSTVPISAGSHLTAKNDSGAGGYLELKDGDDSHYVALKASDTIAADLTFTLPAADGAAQHIMVTDGNKNLSFTNTLNDMTLSTITITQSLQVGSGGSNVVVSSNTMVNLKSKNLTIRIDGGGSAISVSTAAPVYIPCSMTVTAWDILSDNNVSGSIDITVKKTTYADWGTLTDISGTETPSLSSAGKNQDTGLTTWTNSLVSGDYIVPVINSASTVTGVTLILKGTVSDTN